jgi:NAD(P)H-dependent FMN reductase
MRILTVSGSLQAQSGNRALLRVAARLAPTGVEVIFFDGLRELPFFDPDLDGEVGPPAVEAWRQAVADAAAMLIASPEYGHSLPGTLKNGIDWLIGSGELYRKIIAITASVADQQRGRKGLDALAQTLGAVDAVIVWNKPTVRDARFDVEIAEILQRLAASEAPYGESPFP